ncbi:MAG: PEGA domain-containing protein [Acidobacteria bacterium]|nr:PEGA domain-containing protein [Acidobacteriota bacterium]
MRPFILVLLAALGATLALAADKSGAIKAAGKPGRAGVWIDGKYAGPASRFTVVEKYPVDAGAHEVTVRDPEHEDFTTKVNVAAGKTAKVSYKLTKVQLPPPPYGRLRLGGGAPESFMSVVAGDTSPVFLNGKFYGYVDELNNAGGGLLLPPGTYRLKVDSQVHGVIDQDVTVVANKVTVVPLKGK